MKIKKEVFSDEEKWESLCQKILFLKNSTDVLQAKGNQFHVEDAKGIKEKRKW